MPTFRGHTSNMHSSQHVLSPSAYRIELNGPGCHGGGRKRPFCDPPVTVSSELQNGLTMYIYIYIHVEINWNTYHTPRLSDFLLSHYYSQLPVFEDQSSNFTKAQTCDIIIIMTYKTCNNSLRTDRFSPSRPALARSVVGCLISHWDGARRVGQGWTRTQVCFTGGYRKFWSLNTVVSPVVSGLSQCVCFHKTLTL